MFMNRCDGSETRCCWGSATPRLQTKRVKVTFASEPADERVHLTRHAASACFDYVQFTSLINLCCCSEEATAWYWFGRCFSHRRCEVGVCMAWPWLIALWLTGRDQDMADVADRAYRDVVDHDVAAAVEQRMAPGQHSPGHSLCLSL